MRERTIKFVVERNRRENKQEKMEWQKTWIEGYNFPLSPGTSVSPENVYWKELYAEEDNLFCLLQGKMTFPEADVYDGWSILAVSLPDLILSQTRPWEEESLLWLSLDLMFSLAWNTPFT